MSQSDYVKRKRIASQVASKNRSPINREDNPAIFGSQLLTQLKQYDLENTIVNTRPKFNQLLPSSDLRVMEMNLRQPVVACKTYRTCNNDIYNTSNLPNRVLVKTFYDFATDKPFVDPSTMVPHSLSTANSQNNNQPTQDNSTTTGAGLQPGDPFDSGGGLPLFPDDGIISIVP